MIHVSVETFCPVNADWSWAKISRISIGLPFEALLVCIPVRRLCPGLERQVPLSIFQSALLTLACICCTLVLRSANGLDEGILRFLLLDS